MPIFFWDVKSAFNYIEKLKLTGIATTTLGTLHMGGSVLEEAKK
jgi:hypothetical protein